MMRARPIRRRWAWLALAVLAVGAVPPAVSAKTCCPPPNAAPAWAAPDCCDAGACGLQADGCDAALERDPAGVVTPASSGAAFASGMPPAVPRLARHVPAPRAGPRTADPPPILHLPLRR
jgi:hypothetical protein